MRKSPIKHHVRQHRRKGRPVHDYNRGHGSHPFKPKINRTTHYDSSFAVQIFYWDQHSPETYVVNASDPAQAIELAMDSRRTLTPPYQVSVATRQ